MIYKNLKSIFVRIYKTGTTSVLKALQNNQDSVDFKFKIYNKIFFDYLHLTKKKKFPKHLMVDTHSKAIDFRDFLKKEYDEYFKFTFVRNPYDWQVSLYHFMKQDSAHDQHYLVKDMNFDDYIYWRCNHEYELQKDFVVDENGNLIVDFVGKFENLSQDFKIISKKLDLGLMLSEKKFKSSKHNHYSTYYTKKLKSAVDKVFHDDFEFFEYKKEIII